MTRTASLVVGAVAAAAIEFAGVGDGVVADTDGATLIVLDDLVPRAIGTTTLNGHDTIPS